MKKQLFTLTTTIAVMLVILSNTYKTTSTGAPPGNTGAPGEASCARAGCHTGNDNLNRGPGKLAVSFNNGINTYVPGKKYKVTVTLDQDQIMRFGFQALALNSNLAGCGTLHITETTRTQLMQGSSTMANRSYITYKAAGTDPFANGKGQWTFEWEAPATDEGTVTFYVAAVAANNDGTDAGDEVYTNAVNVSSAATTATPPRYDKDVLIFPTVFSYMLHIVYSNTGEETTFITLHNVSSGQKQVLWQGKQAAGLQTLDISKPGNLAAGIYLLELKRNSGVCIKKILIE